MKPTFHRCVVLLAVSFAPLAAAQDADPMTAPSVTDSAGRLFLVGPGSVAGELVGGCAGFMLASGRGRVTNSNTGEVGAAVQGRISPTVMISPSGTGQVGRVGAF
ncbi:MAG TPA: hypothetical protein VK447_03375 [Myxococcaceae bacterium]|nr:hypothetical protein [Myxococcaceae bacterium]